MSEIKEVRLLVRRIKFFSALALLPFFGACEEEELSDKSPTFNHNGVEREYIFYKPNELKQNAPLVFVLHGYTSNAEAIQWYSGMNNMADANGFAVCYPQGTPDYSGTTHWNARLSISQTDDIGFLSELAGLLQEEHNLDPGKTFVCGMSNGGYMSYTLACEAPEIFKAVASVTGTMSGYSWENCDPSEPVPVLQISGVNDQIVPIDGSMSAVGGWGGAPHMDKVIDYWSHLNGCTTTDSLFLSEKTNAYYHRDCTKNHEVWYYKIDDWGHEWPSLYDDTGTNANEAIWSFFSNFSTPKRIKSFPTHPTKRPATDNFKKI